ncbi:MAG: hybrid sensor histidine kinase/response regulator, partial [Luteimonas sp.]
GGQAETREQMISLLDRQTRQLARLVDDLLEVSRIRYGRIELKREVFPLAQAVSAAVDAVHAQVESREQVLATDIEDPYVQLEGDPARVVQILTNLLHNASKYSPSGGRIRVIVQTDAGRSEVVLRVIDEGVGLDAGLLPRVFDLFTQGKRTLDRSEGGLGLGLTLVRRLVEMHGGSIAATSDGPGHGATFTLKFPFPRVNMQSSAGDMQGVESVDPGKRLRVLVVDDNIDAAESLALLLGMEGHELRLAHDGGAALEQAFAFLPDIAFVDIGLPVHDGYEVARALRADQRTSSVFLVAVTGYAQEEDRRRSAAAGFDLHFAKPVAVEMINGALLATAQRLHGNP